MRFKIIGGGYVDANGKNHPKGSIVESNERLDQKFINKIVLVSELPSVSDVPQPNITMPAGSKEKAKKEKGASPSPVGKKKDETEEKDVTKNFPEASEAGYSVIRIGKNQYNVIDTDDNSVVNEEPLKKKSIVEFIESQIIDDDDDSDDEDE